MTGPTMSATITEAIERLWDDDRLVCLSILAEADPDQEQIFLPDDLEQRIVRALGREAADALHDPDLWDQASPEMQNRIIALTVDRLLVVRDELYQRVCVEFDYCARKKKVKNEVELAGLIADILIAIEAFGLGGIPVLSASVALVKWTLDRLCECPD